MSAESNRFANVPSIVAVVMCVFIAALVYRDFVRKPPVDAKIPTLSLLTADNANKPVVLSVAQRELALAQCIAAFHAQGRDGIIHFGAAEDVKRMLNTFANASCNCLVETLASRTTYFEFVLAMASDFSFAPRDDYARFNGGSAAQSERAAPAALKRGLTAKDFDRANARAQEAVMEAGSACQESRGVVQRPR